MSRSPSLPLHDYDDLSSPDPLASSLNEEKENATYQFSSPVRYRSQSPIKNVTVLEDVTFSTPQRSRRTSAKTIDSPSKMISEQTLSPWKIRVTVEAGPEDSNTGMSRHTTKTVKVPLRVASSPVESTQSRQRGRSKAEASTKSKRSGTSLRPNSKSRSRRQNVTDLDIIVLGDEEDSHDWTKQRSPRKRKPRQSQKSDEIHQENLDSIENGSIKDDLKSTKTTRKRTEAKNSIEIHQDIQNDDILIEKSTTDPDSPKLRRIDLNRVSVRPRSGSTKQRVSSSGIEFVENVNSSAQKSLPDEGVRQVSHTSVESYPTPTSSIQGESDAAQNSDDIVDTNEGFDTILESEGFTMIDLESIPSARQFFSSPNDSQPVQMISQGSGTLGTELPHSKPYTSVPTGSHELPQSLQHLPRPTAIPSYLALQDGDSDISSNVPSSPLGNSEINSPKLREVQIPPAALSTPLQQLSPQLPSKPLSPISLPKETKTQKSTPQKLDRVVRAGVALQGVISPKALHQTVGKLSSESRGPTVKDGSDDLFEGFDSGTKRELRAGLRFGEELAKRQRSSPVMELKIDCEKDDAVSRSPSLQTRFPIPVWRGEAVVQHTPLVSQKNNEDMVEKHSLAENARLSVNPKKPKTLIGETRADNSDIITPQRSGGIKSSTNSRFDTQARKEREWKLEREAVSREIENANESRVILIDSDDEDNNEIPGQHVKSDSCQIQYKAAEVDQESNDVWLAVAEDYNSSSHGIELPENKYFSKEEEVKQKLRAKEFIGRPKRSLIPSPWKSGKDVAEASTLLSNGDISGIFWKSPKDRKFGAREIERQKKLAQNSSNNDESESQIQEEFIALSVDEVVVEKFYDEEGFHHQDESHGEEDLDDEQCNLHEGNDQSSLTMCSLKSSSQLANERNDNYEEADDDTDGREETSAYDDSSLPHQPIKIPVNFNDSTISNVAPLLTRSSPSDSDESPRPSTPRSAMKGTRVRTGMDSPLTRKVLFAERSKFLDEAGHECSSKLKSSSPAAEPMTVAYLQEKEVVNSQEMCSAEHPRKERKNGWLSWLIPENKYSQEPSHTKTANDSPSGTSEDMETWNPTRTVLAQSSPFEHAISSKSSLKSMPTYLMAPSYPSDPTRNADIPLSLSGEFSNAHFRTLHIIYRKSQRSRFHAPSVIRSGIQKLVGTKFEVDETNSGLGVFDWVVGLREAQVIERFMQEIELGYSQMGDPENYKWGWTEKELMYRLCRIVVGEVVRAEEKKEVKKVKNGGLKV